MSWPLYDVQTSIIQHHIRYAYKEKQTKEKNTYIVMPLLNAAQRGSVKPNMESLLSHHAHNTTFLPRRRFV